MQFTTIFWSLWKSRIMKLWQQVHETNVQILKRTTYFLEEWKLANNIEKNINCGSINQQPRSSSD